MWLSETDAVTLVADIVAEKLNTTPDPGSSAIDGTLFRFLRRESRRVQARGWRFNTFLARTLTANGSGNIIAGTAAGFGNTGDGIEVLMVRGGGKDHWRNLTLVGTTLYDIATDTDNFGNAGKVDVDVVLGYTDWDDIGDPVVRELIAYRTAWEYQATKVGSMPKLTGLSEIIRGLELTIQRPQPYANSLPINPFPLFPGGEMQGQQRDA